MIDLGGRDVFASLGRHQNGGSMTDSGVVPLEQRSGITRGTLFRPEFRAGIVTNPESVMSHD